MTSKRGLLLWDVDHTLIDTGGLGRELYERAFEAATGRCFEQAAKISGGTEMRIITETLALHDITPTEELRDAYASALVSAYQNRTLELARRGRALDGAAATLEMFAKLGWTQTVVTGNLREVCVTKIRVFGLADNLDLTIGGYAEDGEVRDELVAAAAERARKAHGDEFHGRTIMVGDTPADVDAARRCKIPVVALATGRSTQRELADAGASATLPDLKDADQVWTVISQLL